MKTIYLGYTGNPISITDEAYTQVLALINKHRVCNRCGKPYVEECPEVALNLCLSCFLRKETRLTFVQRLQTNEGGSTTYAFIDQDGYIYLSGSASKSDAERSVERDILQTLQHWHFPVPETYEVDGKTIHLYSNYWRIHGDFRKNSALIIEYREFYGAQLHKQFFTFKDGEYQEMNRRKGNVRQLFAEARRRVEATKDKQGAYHINGTTCYELHDSYLYEVIADILTEEAIHSLK